MFQVMRHARPVALLLVILVLAGGCGMRRVKLSVPISGPPVTRESQPVLDLSNWNGRVKVVVQDRFDDAEIVAKVWRTSRKSPKRGAVRDATSVTAESVVEGGRNVLRVRASTSLDDPSQAYSRLKVRLPSCGGVIVRNAGGTVELRHVAGSINVENGSGSLPGGRVELYTAAPMTEPVTITTSSGTVLYQVGPNSTGRFELTADGGQAAFTALVGKVTFEHSGQDHWVGTLNDGTNPVVLRSHKGTVWAKVIENAGEYKPPRWPVGKVISVEPPH